MTAPASRDRARRCARRPTWNGPSVRSGRSHGRSRPAACAAGPVGTGTSRSSSWPSLPPDKVAEGSGVVGVRDPLRELQAGRRGGAPPSSEVAPLRRSASGSITAILEWLHYADHPLALLRRSRNGSIGAVGDTGESSRPAAEIVGGKILRVSAFPEKPSMQGDQAGWRRRSSAGSFRVSPPLPAFASIKPPGSQEC